MPYATEVEYRAALAAYRALHKVFYRFYASVRAQHPGAWADQLPAAQTRPGLTDEIRLTRTVGFDLHVPVDVAFVCRRPDGGRGWRSR